MKKYLPTGHRVLIKVKNTEKKSQGGIILTEKTRERETAGAVEGTVVALGPTAYEDFTGEPWVSVGDQVMFRRYEGVVIMEDDEEIVYRVVNDDDIYAIIK